MGLQKFANNAEGTLDALISSGAISFQLSSGEGAGFPTLGGGEYCYVRLGTDSSNEVVKVTAISGDNFTCVPTTSGWAAGTPVILTASAEMFADLLQLDGAQTITGVKTFEDGTISIEGGTSGSALIKAPAVAAGVITLPGATGTLASLAGAESLTNKEIRRRVVALADAATVLFDGDLIDKATLTLGSNSPYTLAADTGTPFNGKIVMLEFTQDGTGGRTMAYTAGSKGWAFSTTHPEPTLSTAAGAIDRLLFEFHAADDLYHCIGIDLGA